MRLRNLLSDYLRERRRGTYVRQLSTDRSIIEDPRYGLPFAVTHPELLDDARYPWTGNGAEHIRRIEAERRARKPARIASGPTRRPRKERAA